MHNSLKPQGSATAMTCTKPSPPEELGLNSSTRLTSPGGEPASDCQRLSGPESGMSSEGGGAENIKAPTPDGPGEQHGKKKARLIEVEIPLPPREWLRQDLEWKQILQIGPGLDNLDNTCFCNAVLQCLTHTAPLVNFCLNRSHSVKLDTAAATDDYDALLAVERHIMKAFAFRQITIAPTSIVANLIKMGSHFAAGGQQDAHEFMRS